MHSFRLFSIAALGLGLLAACSDDDTKPSDTDGGTVGSDAGTGGGGTGGKTTATGGASTGGIDAGTGGGTSSGGTDAGTGGVDTDASAGGAGAGTGGTDAGAPDSGSDAGPLVMSLDLADVAAHPDDYTWFDFRPGIKKLILAGDAASEHIAILWYTTVDGGVALHYHAKTESVYVIDGTQTDAKGTYPTGTVYFNPPHSGHQVTGSTGFFLLAYAAPPDFADTSLIEAYTPVKIDTTAADLLTAYPFQDGATGVKTYAPALDATGGMSARLLDTTSATSYGYTGNYVLVLKGSCDIDGATYGEKKVVVTTTTTPKAYGVAAATGATCLALGVSF